jgi:CheY-like chemotaxis protein
MNGEIDHEPRPTGGSIFRFAMELGVAVPPNSLDSAAPAVPEGDRQAPVLVVEDNPTNQRVVGLLLRKWGYRSVVVENGREAVAACGEQDFGAVIMDCQMPVMDGLEATRTIRAREPGEQRVPIIALTAGADLSSRENCLAVGMDDYLTKPVDARQLESALARWYACPGSPELIRS